MQSLALFRLSAPATLLRMPAVNTLKVWRGRLRHREALFLLSRKGVHILEDVGLSAAQVEAELRKPFWRA